MIFCLESLLWCNKKIYSYWSTPFLFLVAGPSERRWAFWFKQGVVTQTKHKTNVLNMWPCGTRRSCFLLFKKRAWCGSVKFRKWADDLYKSGFYSHLRAHTIKDNEAFVLNLQKEDFFRPPVLVISLNLSVKTYCTISWQSFHAQL